MNDTSSPVIVGLLFVLRCLVPLGILFGVSYLLRRLELVTENSDEVLLAEMEEDAKSAKNPVTREDRAKKSQPDTNKKAGRKKKSATSKKKEA
jgi:hypothetical protein